MFALVAPLLSIYCLRDLIKIIICIRNKNEFLGMRLVMCVLDYLHNRNRRMYTYNFYLIISLYFGRLKRTSFHKRR